MLEQWPLIEADLQDRQIDVESGILNDRSARWLKIRIGGLLASGDTRTHRHFAPKPKQ